MIEFIQYGFGNRFIFWPMVVVAIAGFIFISRTFGLRNALMALAAFALALLYALSNRASRQKGWEDRIAKEEKDVQTFQDRIDGVRDGFTVDRDRLRDDDGFKRKP